MTPATVTVRDAGRADRVIAADLLAEAAYTANHTLALLPAADTTRYLTGLTRTAVDWALRDGTILIADDHTGPAGIALALPVHPGQPLIPADVATRMIATLGSATHPTRHLAPALAAVHPTTTAHWWLPALAITTRAQRRGLGKTLLLHTIIRATELQQPLAAYSTNTPYTRLCQRLGFQPLPDPPIGGVRVMWREPAPHR